MCEVVSYKIKDDVYCFCKTTGKKIDISNEFGMYCEDECNLENDKHLYHTLTEAFGGISVVHTNKK